MPILAAIDPRLYVLGGGIFVVLILVVLTRSRPQAGAQPQAAPVSPLPASPASERRTRGRTVLTRPVTVTRAAGAPVRTFTMDVSDDGVLLAGPDDLEVGERVLIELDLRMGDASPVSCVAHVVRTGNDGEKAARFEGLSEVEAQRIRALRAA